MKTRPRLLAQRVLREDVFEENVRLSALEPKKMVRLGEGQNSLSKNKPISMIRVNPYFLHELLTPLVGLADDDEAIAKYHSVDLNDESQARKIIRELIVPYLLTLGPESVAKIRLAYRYYLATENSNWQRVFDSILPPFETPQDVRTFMCWLYHECFQSHDYASFKSEGFVEFPDINEPLAVWSKEKHNR